MLTRPKTLLMVATALLIGAPGPSAQAQQPSADPPPARPEPPPRADNTTPQPGAQPPPARDAKPAPRIPHRLEVPPVRPAGSPAPSPAPPPRPAVAPRPPAKIAKNGFVLQLNLGTDFVQAAIGGVAMAYAYVYGGGPGLNGSFSFGYRGGRWILSLGLDFRRFESEIEGDKSAVSVVAFRPTVAYDLVSTYPLALYLTAGVPIGFMSSDGSGGYYSGSSDSVEPVVGFVVGLGARFFFHPQFAIGMEGAFKGFWIFVETDDYYDDSNRTTIGNVAFSGSIFMMAVF